MLSKVIPEYDFALLILFVKILYNYRVKFFLEGCDEISAGALKDIKTPQANFLVTIIINVNVLILMTTSPKFHINPEKTPTDFKRKGIIFQRIIVSFLKC